jgi:hypothetical protein
VNIFLSKLLDAFYGKSNKTLHIDIEDLGGDSEALFVHDLRDLYLGTGIDVDFDAFYDSKKLLN